MFARLVFIARRKKPAGRPSPKLCIRPAARSSPALARRRDLASRLSAQWRSARAASAITPAADGHAPNGKQERVTPRALRTDEIPGWSPRFGMRAQLCKRAGFDGVEIHGANGYLLESFTRDSSNSAPTPLAGRFENRIRCSSKSVDAAVSVWGRDASAFVSRRQQRQPVPARLESTATYGALVKRWTNAVRLICISSRARPAASGNLRASTSDAARRAFRGMYIGNNRYTGRRWRPKQSATVHVDAVAFGVPFLGNPDLPERLRTGAAECQPTPRPSTGRVPSATPTTQRCKAA